MTTKTATPAEADISAMTFEQLQAELKAIPDQHKKAIHTGDVDAVIGLKSRTAAVKTQLSRIKIGNLKASVERCDQAVKDAMAAQFTANTEGAKEVEHAQAEYRKLEAALAATRSRHQRAIGQMDTARFNLESAQNRLQEARQQQTQAMQELADI